MMWFVLGGVGSYILGSIPFGLLFCFLFGKGDIRTQGSKNIGTTNVLRVAGRIPALLTLVCDMGKAAFASWLLYVLSHAMDIAVFCGVCAVLGHNFSVFLRFKGGKGVASTLAVLCVWHGFLGLFAVGVWVLVAVFIGYSSLSAIVMFIVTPIFAFVVFKNTFLAVACLFLSVMGLIKHSSNIGRLWRGEEKKIFRRNKVSSGNV